MLAVSLLLLRWLELRFIIIRPAFEVYAIGIALLFTGLGIVLVLKLSKPYIKTHIVEKEIYVNPRNPFVVNQNALEEFGLSEREMEVLQLMAKGLSNQEIADHLFLSLHTIKTHNGRLFDKMDVKSRTQAIALGKKCSIIP